MFQFRRWHMLCLCLLAVLLVGGTQLSDAKVIHPQPANPADGQKVLVERANPSDEPIPPIEQATPPDGPTPPENQTGKLSGGSAPPGEFASDATSIVKGDPIGILYYINTGQTWTVGVHNGISLDNLSQGQSVVPLGHYSNTSFTEGVLCFHKPTQNDKLGGFRRIATESYPSPYTKATPIGYEESDGTVHNAGFISFKPASGGSPISDAGQAAAASNQKGTLTYGHWNIRPSTVTNGAQELFWEVASKFVIKIQPLTVITYKCNP